jgi:hypothetical protein
MEYRKESQGLQTFIEHLGMLPLLVVSSLGCHLFFSLMGLKGHSWLAVLLGSFVLQVLGCVLIGYAKLPAYRDRRYFTFGLQSVPAIRAGYYRWGWRLFSMGVALSLLLLLPMTRHSIP